MGGGGSSKGGGGRGGQASRVAETQAQIAERLAKQTDPLRQAIFTDELGEGALPPGLLGARLGQQPIEPLPQRPISPFQRTSLEGQTQVASENILRTTPRGGLQRRLLADVQLSRTQGLQGLAAQREQQDFADQVTEITRREEEERQRTGRTFQAADVGTGTAQVSLGGLGSAGGVLSQLASVEQQREQAAKQFAASIGQSLGAGAGFAAGGGLGSKGVSQAGASQSLGGINFGNF